MAVRYAIFCGALFLPILGSAVSLPTISDSGLQLQLTSKRGTSQYGMFASRIIVPNQRVLEEELEPLEFTILDSASGDGVPYSGIATFAHLPWLNCFDGKSDGEFDIGILGMPFDLGVTYRPGARFGPGATRMAARRLLPDHSYE